MTMFVKACGNLTVKYQYINIHEGSPLHPSIPPWIFSSPCFLLSSHWLRCLSISPYWFYLLCISSPRFYCGSTRKVFCHPVRVVSLFWETSCRYPSSNGWSTWSGRRSSVTPLHSHCFSLLRSFRSHLLTKLCREPHHCTQYPWSCSRFAGWVFLLLVKKVIILNCMHRSTF